MANEINIKVTVDGKQGEVSLEQLTNKFLKFLNTAETVKQSISSKFSDMGNIVTGFNQGLEAAQKILSFLSKPVKLTIDAEQAKVSFEVLLGSADAANRKIAELKADSAKTPYEFTDLQNGTKVMLNFGIAADQVRPILLMIGDIAGGDAQKLSSLALVMGQVASAGKLQGQDLLQLINAGFNPLQEISRTTNKSMASLRKEMENGKISYDMVIGAFKSATAEGGRFHNMMEKQSHTLGGLLSTVNDYISQGLVKFANSGLFQTIKGTIENVTKAFEENGALIDEYIGYIGTAVGFLAETITNTIKSIIAIVKSIWDFKEIIIVAAATIGILTAVINADVIALKLMYAWDAIVAGGKLVLTLATNGLTIAQSALNAVMNMSPIGWIISIVGILITIITVVIGKTIGWGKAFEYLKAGILIAWDYMKAFGNFVIQFSLGITQLLTLPYQIMYRTAVEMFSKIGSMMKKLVTGDFTGLWEDIKSGFVTGFNDTIKSTINSFQSAFNSFDGLGDKASQRWGEAGKKADNAITNKSETTGGTVEPGKTPKSPGDWKEDKSAIDKLEAQKKLAEAKAKESIEDELQLQQELLNIGRKFDLLKVKYEKEHEKDRAALREKINADYDGKQSDLNIKKKNALRQLRKEELDAAWELRNKELQYSEATDLDILNHKKIYLEMVRSLYSQNTKEYLAAQREINSVDLDILIASRLQKKAQQENNREISNTNQRLKLTKPGKEQALEEFDSKTQFDKEVDEWQKKFDKEEITADDFFIASENAEKAHQQRLLEIKTKYYDNWLGRLAKLSRAEIDAAKQIVDNIGDVFGKIGSLIAQSAKEEADSTKESNKEKLEADREKALSYARTQQQKDKVNKEYDIKVKKMEDDADKRAREKAEDWFAIQKAASITNAIISTYEGANKTIAQGGFWGIALSIATIAAGLANVAVIASQPIPKFARGIIGIDGPGTENSDSIPAWLSKNESVINADSTKAASPLLKLINGSASMARKVSDFIMNGDLPFYAAGISSFQEKYSTRNSSGTYVNNNGELLGEIKSLNKNMQKYAETGMNVKLELGTGFANKLYKMGQAGMRREKLL